MNKFMLLFLFVFCFVVSGFTPEEGDFDWSRPMLGKKAPALEVDEWLTEKPATEGKFVVLDFWSTYCGPCVKFTPQMNKFAKMFEKDAVFIAVALQSKASMEKGIKMLKKVKKELNEEFTPIEFYQATDAKSKLYQAYCGENIPMVIVIDPQGIVRWQGNPHGEGGKNGLTVEVIKELIAKYKK